MQKNVVIPLTTIKPFRCKDFCFQGSVGDSGDGEKASVFQLKPEDVLFRRISIFLGNCLLCISNHVDSPL